MIGFLELTIKHGTSYARTSAGTRVLRGVFHRVKTASTQAEAQGQHKDKKILFLMLVLVVAVLLCCVKIEGSISIRKSDVSGQSKHKFRLSLV